MSILALTCGLTLAVAAPQQDEAASWSLLVESTPRSVRIDPTGERAEVDVPALILVSPNGRRRVEITDLNPGVTEEREIRVVPIDGAPPIVLARDAVRRYDMQWMPDSRHLVSVRDTRHEQRVCLVDVDAAPPTEQTISDDARSWMPRVSKDGRVAFVTMRERKGKQEFSDLVIWRDGVRETIATGLHITDVAWSPDGTKLAYSTVGELVVRDMTTGTSETRTFLSLDERLYAHLGTQIAWRPDGQAIAMSITFAGGRMIMPGEPDDGIFGDREVFVVPASGPGVTVHQDLPSRRSGLRWIISPSARQW